MDIFDIAILIFQAYIQKDKINLLNFITLNDLLRYIDEFINQLSSMNAVTKLKS